VTAKIRLGFDKKNFLEVAKIVEEAGADAITVHCRMAYDSYKVPADWKFISEIKKVVKIPVIGNGDVATGKQAAEMLKIADGCMIARAAIGDPLIFTRILHYLKTGKEKTADIKENLKLFLEYLQLAKKYDVVELPRIKSLGGYFLRGFDGAAQKRNGFMKLTSFSDVQEFVQKLL
jgi:tRNA-dihydrouridine synthase